MTNKYFMFVDGVAKITTSITGKVDQMGTDKQSEIEAMIEEARQTKLRFGYDQGASVHKLWINSRRFVLGFNFKQGVNAGDVYTNDDGSRCEVIAVV